MRAVVIPPWLAGMAVESDEHLTALPRINQPAWFQQFDDERNGRVPPCKTCGQVAPDEP